VIAQGEDVTADLVVEALRVRGAEVSRIDTADFPRRLSLAAAPDPEAVIDWRRRYETLRYEVIDTPVGVRTSVRAYLHAFGLNFGAFDFSVAPDGSWWFLECNPAGQWGWIAEETGLPIADAIADELVRNA
jgi:hypothetical protein